RVLAHLAHRRGLRRCHGEPAVDDRRHLRIAVTEPLQVGIWEGASDAGHLADESAVDHALDPGLDPPVELTSGTSRPTTVVDHGGGFDARASLGRRPVAAWISSARINRRGLRWARSAAAG